MCLCLVSGSWERVTAYDAFVRPVLAKQREEGRGGLEVLCHHMGYRVHIQDGRAVRDKTRVAI